MGIFLPQGNKLAPLVGAKEERIMDAVILFLRTPAEAPAAGRLLLRQLSFCARRAWPAVLHAAEAPGYHLVLARTYRRRLRFAIPSTRFECIRRCATHTALRHR